MDETTLGRIPPHDLDAERAVLGSMMLSKDAISDVSEILTGREYYRPNHETIHDVIIDLYSRGEPVDPLTVGNELERAGTISRVGGAAYLHELVAMVPATTNAGHYARIVYERWQLRRLIDAGMRVVQLGYSQGGEDVADLVDAAQAEVYAVSEGRERNDYVAWSEVGAADGPLVAHLEALEKRGNEKGVPTGLRDLDDLTMGLHPGQMIIVAARPAMGKSTLALNFLRAASVKNNITSVVFSLEMSREEIAMRLLSAESQVHFSHMRKGAMDQNEWKRIGQTLGRLEGAPLFIDDSPNMAMNEIRAKCRRLKQQHNLGLVVIDYLQLMTSGKKVESRQQEVSEFSRSLKLLAKELEVPVVAVAQLNRGPESRNDKKPMIADLRESGSLEQDADVILLLHRADYYEEDKRPGEADIIVAKHRNGETRTLPVAFQGHFVRFHDLAREAPL